MAKPRTKKEKLALFEAWLRQNFPTPYPVVYQYRRLEGSGEDRVWGDTCRVGRKLYITVDPRMTLGDSLAILIHEYAHAMVWRHETIERHRVHHDAEWGIAYAKVYSAWHDVEET